MKALELGCLTSALSLVVALAPSMACARDTHVVKKTAHAAHASRSAATVKPLVPASAEATGLTGGSAVSASTVSESALPSTTGPVRVDITKSDPPAEASCDKDCELSSSSEISLLPKVVMRTLFEMPVVGAFLITPVTTGVTVAPVDGLPALTFTVKPTKVTQGSGLVAIGRF